MIDYSIRFNKCISVMILFCPTCKRTRKGSFCLECGSSLIEEAHRTNGSAPLIHAQDLHKSYLVGKMPVYALRGVSLEILQGEFIAIMGPSGSGKSTLMHLVGALDSPTQGHVVFEGQNLGLLNSNQLADFRLRQVGFVFQNFYLVPSLKVIENVMLPLVYANDLSKNEQESRATSLLSDVGLEERLNHYPSELSGGEQQRVALARALANKPRLILADEPTGDLDSKNGQVVIDLLKELNSAGQTICMVTHDIRLAEQADRVVELFDGKIVTVPQVRGA